MQLIIPSGKIALFVVLSFKGIGMLNEITASLWEACAFYFITAVGIQIKVVMCAGFNLVFVRRTLCFSL